MEKKRYPERKDNSFIGGINNILNLIENGKKSEISEQSIQNVNPTINTPSFMSKVRSNKPKIQ